jgi:NADPH:quinone reductase-like Zn-dependent oxidoreductase
MFLFCGRVVEKYFSLGCWRSADAASCFKYKETYYMSGELVLVTGGSGFIGVYCIQQLLETGYRVRATVRSLAREADVRVMLKAGGAEPGETL